MTPPDYESLIDSETWAFIRLTAAAYPADTASQSIAAQREIYDRMCRLFFRGYPPGVTATDRQIGQVPCRVYPGHGPTVIYAHGGGFVVGGLHSHDDVCAEICDRTGFTVVSVDYRLSPEHRHPAALNDVIAVIRAIASESGGPILLAGDSAGANLVAAASHAVGRNGAHGIAGQVLIYPGLGGDLSRGSAQTHAHAPMLTLADIQFYAGIRHGGTPPGPDPTVSPLQDTDFAGLPPTLALGAECDPLADDAPAYAALLIAAGVTAQAIVEPGLVHGHLRARKTVSRAARSFDRVIQTLTAMARNTWAGDTA